MPKKTKPKKQTEDSKEKSNSTTQIRVAILGLAGLVIAALIAGISAIMNTRMQIDRPAMLTLTAQSFLPSAPPTLTPTATPTSSPTYMVTPDSVAEIAVTNTLEPKVVFIVPEVDELTSLPILFRDYIDSVTPESRIYKKTVKWNESYLWKYYWCAKYDGTLQDNLQEVDFVFLIDDVIVPKDNFLKYKTHFSGVADPDWICQGWATILTKWSQGNSIKLSIFYTIPRPMSDGENMYQPGDYRHDIIVSVE